VRLFALYLQKVFQIVLVFSGDVCSAQTRKKRAGVFGITFTKHKKKGGITIWMVSNYLFLEGYEKQLAVKNRKTSLSGQPLIGLESNQRPAPPLPDGRRRERSPSLGHTAV
jgi:hypothetical protein